MKKKLIVVSLLIFIVFLSLFSSGMLSKKVSIVEHLGLKQEDIIDILLYDFINGDYNNLKFEYSVKETSSPTWGDQLARARLNKVFGYLDQTKISSQMLPKIFTRKINSYSSGTAYRRIIVLKTTKGDFKFIFDKNQIWFLSEYEKDNKKSYRHLITKQNLEELDRMRHRNPPQMSTPTP